MKADAATKKNQVSETGRNTFIVLYCILLLALVFPVPVPLFYLFLTSNVVALCALIA
jgi:hypothetical protein